MTPQPSLQMRGISKAFPGVQALRDAHLEVRSGEARRAGFEQAMREAGIPIVDRATADWKEEVARDKTDALLSAHPDVRGILAANDKMALGALAALQSKGLSGKVILVGYDNIKEVQEQIRNGAIQASVEQHPDTMGSLGVRAALALIQGQPWASRTDVPTEVITAKIFKQESSRKR